MTAGAGPSASGRAESAGGSARTGRTVSWTLWTLLAVAVAAVLALFAHQVVTGDFWLWGIPDPMPVLLFFAGPVAVLTLLALLLLARTALPRRDRLLISLSAATLVLVVAHLLLSDRVWWWDVPDLLPSLAYLLLPLAVLAVALAARWRGGLARATAWSVAVLGLPALVLGVSQAGLNLAALHVGTPAAAGVPAPSGALRVVSWDTIHWDLGESHNQFYRYLTSLHADVYLLQDYQHNPTPLLTPVYERQRLRSEFPGYHVAVAGDLLTVSRFPIVAETPFPSVPPPAMTSISFVAMWKYGALRTDLAVDGRVLSVYNVHFYDRLALDVIPLSPAFLRDEHQLDSARRQQFASVTANISADPRPVLVSGNFNTPPGAGNLRLLDGLRDAGSASTSVYPTTFAFIGPRIWRLDWTFASPAIRVLSYQVRAPHGLSTHSAQDLLIALPQRGQR
jgi:endonuclease/exonuclease/phosphatase (EEP) superfamily protein YafD